MHEAVECNFVATKNAYMALYSESLNPTLHIYQWSSVRNALGL